MHAVFFMGMPTASSKGGVPLTGMQHLTTMARKTLEAACIGARAANEIFDINPDQLFKKTHIAMKNPSFQKYNI